MAHNKFVQLLLFAILPHLASSQTVTLCVGELNGNVYVEWTGSLTALYQNPLEQTGITPQLSGNAFAFAAPSNRLLQLHDRLSFRDILFCPSRNLQCDP
jgi:hypothetical protein